LFFLFPCRPKAVIGGRGVKLLEMEKAIEMLLSRVMIQTSGACCDARLRAQMLLH
jgi:hypothetical protein